MLENLMVHIPTELPVRPVVDGAISLAMARNTHLHAVSVGYESTTVGLAADGGAAAAATLFAMEHDEAERRAKAALAVFETEARNAGIAYSMTAIMGPFYETAAQVGALARLADLTVVLQPEYGRETFDNTLPLEILFQGGGPVLFVPPTHKGPLNLKRIGIAWDGSRPAARAVRDAAPFLAAADSVAIISINEAGAPEQSSAAELAKHLARQGLAAEIERLVADKADIHATILSIAADTGSDLLVMGAYGHSRLQEQLLGGVTRSMLRSMTIPVLMSH
jgi:nucleotide-binding universal stress UspA family protein